MVKVEVGGKPILDFLPGVEITDANGNPKPRPGARSIRRPVNGSSSSRMHFSWSPATPRLIVTSDTDDFDDEIISHFKDEGFQIWYMPYAGDKQAYHNQLQHLADPLELGETYAIVAYGDAAALVLEACMRPMPKLCALVAYYPPYMPKTSANFPPTLHVTIHLAGSQKFGTRHERNYRYPGTQSGFAEGDLEEYSKPDARVAWTRTLATLKRGFGIDDDLEGLWDYQSRLLFNTKDADTDDIMKSTSKDASVINVPTQTGGVGRRELRKFYDRLFTGSHPPDLKTRLLSRTEGTSRVVDEMFVSFTHNTEMEWILPGIPPTGKQVEIVLVVVVTIRGGKLVQENIYWDQASVLVQIGLLDPRHIPSSFTTKAEGREADVKRLPVLGVETARRVVDEQRGRSNELVDGW